MSEKIKSQVLHANPATGQLTSVSAKLLQPSLKLQSAVIVAVSLTVAAAIAWSSQARIVEVASGLGRVIPATRNQLVQNLEGGIIKEILVREGSMVEKGTPLLRIDPSSSGFSLDEMRQRMVSLEAAAIRLQALLDGFEPVYPATFSKANPELVARSNTEYEAARSGFEASVASFEEVVRQKEIEKRETEARIRSTQQSLSIASEQLTMFEKLQKSGAASKADVLAFRAKTAEMTGTLEELELAIPRIEAAVQEAQNRKREAEGRFRAETAAALNEAVVKLNAMREASNVDADRIRRADVRAPVDGIIKTLHANTIGQVVKPGEDIVEIVPTNESLVVQAQIRPQDIAFLHPGQKAVIKISAYDYAIYGSIDGTLERIGADSVVDEKGNAHFPVDVHAEKAWLENNGKRLPIIPGMVAQVDIVTGGKTVLSYVTKPIHRMALGAFRER